jgi:mRNA interferase RelE/StbE
MAYRLEISKLAQKDLAKLDKVVLEAIRKRLKRLAETADDIAHLPLKGPLQGFYKLRVYDKYRIIYDWKREEKIIVVIRVGNRSDIYRE